MNVARPCGILVLVLLFVGSPGVLAATESAPPDGWQRQLEREWLLEEQVRAEAQHPARLSPADDAQGGCDGVTNGKWGFHTAEQEKPWWEGDLGTVTPLAQVRVWNRSDNDLAAKRASRFQLLLSDAVTVT